MKITLSIDSKESIEINHTDLATIIGWLDDDVRYALFLSRLVNHPASEVRSAVAGKTTLPIEALEALVNDASIEVVRQVANNDRALGLLELAQIQEMIRRDVSVAGDIADNLHMMREDVREGVIQTLLQHTDPKVAETAESFEFNQE